MGINFQDVTFKYSKKQQKNTINKLNLSINNDFEFIAILGHTGSGKSTLVQLMNALNVPSSGYIYINNQIVSSSNRKNKKIKFKLIRSHVGLVFQFPEYQLFEDTVLKDIMFGPKNFGKSTEEAKTASLKVCELLGISDKMLERSPFSLSGGQMRKVAIAGILASNPNILILDEPTVGLDPKGKDELMRLLKKIQETTHKTIIMISHDMNIVAEYASRILVMQDGNLVYDGDKRALFENYQQLASYNLDLPESAKLAIRLKEENLINYIHLPLTKEELKQAILNSNGDNHE
ncbi:MAG: energy-coupling factor transporter ATPase [Bacilli bacterium]